MTGETLKRDFVPCVSATEGAGQDLISDELCRSGTGATGQEFYFSGRGSFAGATVAP